MLTHIGLQRNKETIPTFGVGVIKECFFIIVVSPNVNPRHVYYARLQNKCYRLMSEMVTMGDQRRGFGSMFGHVCWHFVYHCVLYVNSGCYKIRSVFVVRCVGFKSWN